MTETPLVSIAVANFNGARFLEAAVHSALAQSVGGIEVIIVDDRSTDASPAIAERLAAADKRVSFHRLPENRGPAGARNKALEVARGIWFAVLDNDDLYHPQRLARLIARAEADGADIIADDLLLFSDDGTAAPHRFLKTNTGLPFWIDLESYLNQTVMFGRAPNLGFLKPVIRREALIANNLCYDERLRIAEDDDLVIRMLAAGLRYRIDPSLSYFYRKHGSSISHRMADHHLIAMIEAGERNLALMPEWPRLLQAFHRRQRAFARALAFSRFIDELKGRRFLAAARIALLRPAMLPLLRMPVAGRLARLKRGAGQPLPQSGHHATIISRQRLVGPTNGSSAYLLDVAAAIQRAGFTPHLVQPSPSLLGRTPFVKLQPAMRIFATHRVRGVLHYGDWLIARNPIVWLSAARGILSRLARRVGLKARWFADRPAPYSVAMPWEDADRLFVADALRGCSDVVIADYIFQAEAFPYALRGDARTAIVMHDLFHRRTDGLKGSTARDSVAEVDRATEIALLGSADAVIAIQAAEAEFVAGHVSGTEVLLAPMAAKPVPAPQPGRGSLLLFVGSNTAPNVVGLRWFLDEVWPSVRAAIPEAELNVAGTVGRAFDQAPPGVAFLGLVDDLDALYREAAVFVSPLTFGSGLKIKLIEALAAGKAIVATSVTLQGVEELVGPAIRLADAAPAFAEAVIAFLADPAMRAASAACALDVARAHFSSETAHVALAEWLQKEGENEDQRRAKAA